MHALKQRGLVETYRVVFKGGQTVVWGIGGLKDGKFNTLYTAG